MQPPDPNIPQRQFDPQQPAQGFGGSPAAPGCQSPPPMGVAAGSQSGPQQYAYPGYPPSYGYRPPQVRFDVFGDAWKLFVAQMGTWLLAGLLAGLIMGAIMSVFFLILSSTMSTASKDPTLMFTQLGKTMVIEMVFGFLIGIAGMLLYTGMCNMAIRQARGQQIGIGDMFDFRDVFLSVVVSSLALFFLFSIGRMFCLIPGFIAMGIFMFTIPLVLDQKLGPFEALSKSWEALSGQLWPATGFFFVAILLAELGMLGCGVGALLTVPLFPLSIALLYRDFFINPRPGEIQITHSDSGSGPPIPEPN